MPAVETVRPRERLAALAAVVLVQAGLVWALLNGLHVGVTKARDSVERLIDITLPNPPPPVTATPAPRPAEHRIQSAPKVQPAPKGGSPGPSSAHVMPVPVPAIAVRPSAPAAGGGTGSGPAIGAGAGGGSGGNGFGDDADDGGTDLEHIAGEITSRDYPRELRDAGVGGRVEFVFTVQPNGRVGRCTVTRSSGVPELDALTCRLVQQRFVYRPSTDRFGRPIADEVEGEHDWVGRR